MSTDNRTPAEIEREIEVERAQLTGTLEELQDKFSVDTIIQQVTDNVRMNSGEYGRAISQSVKDNPIGLAITAVGLGWLIMGSSQKRVVTAYGTDRDYAEERARRGTDDRLYAPSSTARAVGSMDDTGTMSGSAAMHSRASGMSSTYSEAYAPPRTSSPSWSYAGYDGDDEYDDAYDDDGYDARSTEDASPSLGERASGALADARDKLDDTTRRLSSGMTDRKNKAARRAESVRRRLSEGTDELSEEARRRVVAARYRAIEARDAATRNLRRAEDGVMAFYEEQPLVVGALALAVGAAIAGALPRTRAEDAYLGEQRDALLHDAERIYHEERSKIEKVAGAALKEAKNVMDETREEVEDKAPDTKDVTDEAKSRVVSAGQRVADAAKSEAEKQKLGTPSA